MNPTRQAGPPPPAVPDAQRWNRDRGGPRNRPLVLESSPYAPPPPHTMPPMPMHPMYYTTYMPPYAPQSPLIPEQMMPMMHPHLHAHPQAPLPPPQAYAPRFPIPTPTPPPAPVVVTPRPPFFPPLPWYSSPDIPFPKRRPRRKLLTKKRSTPPTVMVTPSNLPQSLQPEEPEQHAVTEEPSVPEPEQQINHEQPALSEIEHATPSQTPSEADSTHPTTPASVVSAIMPTPISKSVTSQVPPPVVPPVVPRKAAAATPAVKETKRQPPKSKPVESIKVTETKVEEPKVEEPKFEEPKAEEPKAVESEKEKKEQSTVDESTPVAEAPAAPAAPAAPKPASPPPAPKSWARIVKDKTVVNAKPSVPKVNGPAITANSSIGDVLAAFDLASESPAPYLQPRGLENSGNMCFMNAVLQMLVFCGPFYKFLRHVGTKVPHSFKGNTPLIDAMISFMGEFTVQVGPAASQKDADEFGAAFTPEDMYTVIHRLERFSTFTPGHQHDAEEFLGFLLDGLHEEAVSALKLVQSKPGAQTSSATEDTNGWMEVGNKGRAASTRKTIISESPVTKIFGGNLRSEFKVPGSKPSVTLEPYQPLQLDIHPPQVTSIIDALKHLTKPDTINGDFGNGRGTATKQVLIDSLPPVLILHLKRFQYIKNGVGTQKIWKTIGYPLILEIPLEVLSPINRSKPKPKYKLTGVIYHHGKEANGGHYTADVLRQDGKSWIRLDDTKISKVSPQEVAVNLTAEQARAISLEPLSDEGVNTEGGLWEHANGSNSTSRVQGRARPPVSTSPENGKVAYILFYQRI